MTTKNLRRSNLRRSALPLGIASALALAIAAAGGTSVVAAPRPDQTAALAQAALSKGQVDKAIKLAETAVQGSPREATYRAVLGHAYLKAGRFASAATTFNDAMELGDNSARTALGLALSNVAAGRNQEAIAILDDWRDAVPASDLGLALALAGETTRGVAIMADALRNGDNSAKLRQNLAYAYALDGRWREARMMASQDVPANQIDDRIGEWASRAQPEAYHQRIAALLGTPMRSDPGQPERLALSSSPASEQLAVESTAAVAAPRLAAAPVRSDVELPAVDDAPAAAVAAYTPPPAAVAPVAAPAPAQQSFAQAFASNDQPSRVQAVSRPVVQSVPAQATRTKAAAPVRVAAARVAIAAPRAATPAVRAAARNGSHLVQLGSFSSQQGARRAWGILSAKNPELRGYRMTITPAVVRGKNFWRVAAAGLDASRAGGMCSTVKARGGVCFAYSGVQRTIVPRKAAPTRSAAGPALARRR